MSHQQQTISPFASVQINEYRNLMIGRFLFVAGLRMIGTLCGWWIYNLTNDPFAIGLIGLAEVIPAVSLALYAGHVIDISEKRKLILSGVMLYCLASVILFALSFSQSKGYLASHSTAIFIYAVIFCTGIIRAFTGPVFATLVGSIVPKELLQNATSWNQGIWLAASVSGHAACGLLIAAIGNTATLGVIVSLIIISFFILATIKKRPAIAAVKEKPTLESVREGLRFVFKTKEVLGALSLDMFAVLFGGAVAMIPVFARDILKIGPQGFGWLNAATDLGSICMVIILTVFPMRRHHGKKLLLAVAGFGICIIIFALSKNFVLSFMALMISGMLDGVSVVVRGTILQLKTPPEMRGRVLSVNSMFINSSNELGQFESGIAAKALGVIPSVVFGGCMTILVVIITSVKAPSLKEMEY